MTLDQLIQVTEQIIRLAPGRWTLKILTPRTGYDGYGLSLRDSNGNVFSMVQWDDAWTWLERQELTRV